MNEVARDLKLGFNTNITNTNDQMKWSNMNKENYSFIKDITGKSYIDDNSFLTSFIDYYYNLNYINVEKALQESLDLSGAITISDEGIDESSMVKTGKLYLVNKEIGDSRYNVYIDNFTVLNKINTTVASRKRVASCAHTKFRFPHTAQQRWRSSQHTSCIR